MIKATKTNACVTLASALAIAAFSSPSFAKRAIPSQSRNGLEALCKKYGGEYTLNLDSYHCVLTCTSPDGKNKRTCAINCDANGQCSIVGNYEVPKRSIGLKDLITGGRPVNNKN